MNGGFERMVQLLEAIHSDIQGALRAITLQSKGVFSRKDAAEYLGIHINSLDQLVRQGKIKRVPLHTQGNRGRVGFRREELDRFITKNETVYEELLDHDGKAIIEDVLRNI